MAAYPQRQRHQRPTWGIWTYRMHLQLPSAEGPSLVPARIHKVNLYRISCIKGTTSGGCCIAGPPNLSRAPGGGGSWPKHLRLRHWLLEPRLQVALENRPSYSIFDTAHNNKFHQVLFFQQTFDLINFIPWSFYLNVSSFPWCFPCLFINTFAIIGSVIQVIILVELDTWACWFHTVVPLPKQQTCIMLSIYQVPSPALAVQKLDCLSLCHSVYVYF